MSLRIKACPTKRRPPIRTQAFEGWVVSQNIFVPNGRGPSSRAETVRYCSVKYMLASDELVGGSLDSCTKDVRITRTYVCRAPRHAFRGTSTFVPLEALHESNYFFFCERVPSIYPRYTPVLMGSESFLGKFSFLTYRWNVSLYAPYGTKLST